MGNSIYTPEPFVSTPNVEVDLLSPHRDSILLSDIATSLSRKGRYTDLSERPITVGHHLLLCNQIARAFKITDPHVRLAILLHDAHEYILGDWNRPLKRYVNSVSNGALASLEAGLDRAIASSVGLPMRVFCEADVHGAIKSVDTLALAIEVEYCFSSVKDRWDFLPDLTDPEVCPLSREKLDMLGEELVDPPSQAAIYHLLLVQWNFWMVQHARAMNDQLNGGGDAAGMES